MKVMKKTLLSLMGHYLAWSAQTKFGLMEKGLWEMVILNPCVKLENEEESVYQTRLAKDGARTSDYKAQGVIGIYVRTDYAEQIADAEMHGIL